MLRKVRIRNFKSFRDATFPLGNFSLVVGANGTGKSNLFDALRFLKFIGMGTSIRDAIEGHVSATPSDFTVPGIRGGSQALTHFASKSKVFDITVDVKSASDELRYSISVDAINYRVVSEELVSKKHPGSYVFSTHPDINPLAQDAESPIIWARFYKVLAWLEDVLAWDLGKPTSPGFDPKDWRLGAETDAFASDRVKHEIDWVLYILRRKEGVPSGMQGDQEAASRAAKARKVIRAELATGEVQSVPRNRSRSSPSGDGGVPSRAWLGDPHADTPRGD
jgi:hypothetical protein